MSYINEALRRAQKTRDNPYVAYRRFIEAGEGPPRRVGYKALWASLCGLLLSAAMLLIVLATGIPFGGIGKEARTTAAAPVAEKTVEATPPLPRAVESRLAVSLFEKAIESQRLLRFAQAQELYEQIIAVLPDHKMSLNNLGVLFLEKGEYEKARHFFERALQADAAWAEPRYNLACLAARQGRPQEGLAHLRQAITIFPPALEWAAQDEDLRNVRLLPEYAKLKEALGK